MTDPKKELTKLDPIISEFATQEEADEYDAWFRKQVQDALDDPGEDIPHEEVMRQARETIERAAARGLAEGKQAAYAASGVLDPIISEFATQEEADAYDAWFRKKVQAAIDDPGELIPHDEAMARVRATIDRVSKKRA
jgi:hypothetical protein